MRFSGKYALCAIAMTVLALACKKGDDTSPNPTANYMTATIDGGYWTATDISRTIDGGDTLRFTGSRSNSKPVLVQLAIYKYKGAGTYKLNDTAARAIYTTNGAEYKAYSGTITITADDQSHVTANFQFSAQEKVTGAYKDITNGQLSVNK